MKLFEAKDYDRAVPALQNIIRDYPGTYTELAARTATWGWSMKLRANGRRPWKTIR